MLIFSHFNFDNDFFNLKGAEYGAVTALGINMDCTRLLCGHARGQVSEKNLSL